MLIGYARVSATHQNLDRQLAMLKAEGCGRIFKEKLSGREVVRRPQLDKAIEALGTGDVLVLAEWDRVTRSMLDGIRIIERVAARGATFKALDRKWLDLTTPIGRGILAFLSSLAEDERARILARANGGRAAAKKRGVKCETEAGSAPGARSRPYGSQGGQEPARGRAPLSRRPFNHCASPRACGVLSAL
jgi:DNA invertase Pin-like site-specific DNA recombinase